jgi:hypothetical protein
VGPGNDALPFGGKPFESLTAQHDNDVEFVFEPTYRHREGWLAHVACRRGATEMALARQRHQILQLLDRYLAVHPPTPSSTPIAKDYRSMSDRKDQSLVCRRRRLLASLRRHDETPNLLVANLFPTREHGCRLLAPLSSTERLYVSGATRKEIENHGQSCMRPVRGSGGRLPH